MKLLHSKSTAEPILAVTACPCANLFGLVTRSSAAVYRSTTLTTVFNFSLKPFQSALRDNAADEERRNDTSVCCCWSPSGRLFTLAMPSGLLLVLDVEGGALVRFLTPGATAPVSSDGASGSSSTPASTSVPRVPTTLPPGRPVLAMGWCAVPSLFSRHVNAMHVDMQTRCLPVRTGVTTALLDEVAQGSSISLFGAGDASHLLFSTAATSGRYPADAKRASRSISLLMVLGCDGVLRCLIGGLYEVQRLELSLPSCYPTLPVSGLRGNVAAWEDVVVEDMQVRHCTVSTGASAGSRTHPQRETGLPGWMCFGESVVSCVRPAVAQQHRLYLTVAGALSSGAAAPAVWEVNLHANLSALAAPHWLALCYVREYTRIAREVYEKAAREWHAVLRRRLWAHLGLPAVAPLLSSAILAQLTEPDPLELYKYAKQQLMHAAVTEDLEVMATAVQRAIDDVTHVCYRCCEAAMACTVYLREADTVTQHLGTLRRLCESFLRRVTREAESARDLALWVLQQSHYWSRSSRFAMGPADERAPVGAEEDQRERLSAVSSPSAAVAATTEMTHSPSPQQPPSVVDEVPLSATRQPTLLSYLSSVTSQETNVEDDPVVCICEQLAISLQDCASLPASAMAPLPACIVLSNVQESGATSASPASQFLCCVVKGTEEGERGSRDGRDDNEDIIDTSVTVNGGDGYGNDDGMANGYYPRYETGLEDVALGEGTRDVACGECGCALVTEGVDIHVLRCAATAANTIRPLQIGTYKVVVHRDGDAGDDCADSSAASGAVLEAGPTVDVDITLITSRLKVDLSSSHSYAAPSVIYGATWYGYLEADRHVVVCQPNSITTDRSAGSGAQSRSAAPAPFFVAVVDGSGRLVTVDEEERDDGDNEDGGDAADSSAAALSTEAALCEVTGMEGVPLRVSMSRARSFCVVASVTKYIVLSLYDDDY
ncbi:hypothetical protein LPMP_240910 [Leishmania panamensis]|uniref:Anaphase-promoting complex subunit 4 WD40 domain-containing protein n=1 Tax=Leishmania panamensis TaxID=5679 RepID=A0A088RU15_LEIPA|nr:hypothetical protein LPMP_240910 [Leishmania panamensis]AIN98724.1 hypothetical protein LPMP_240910 [Leishmania panamensis]